MNDVMKPVELTALLKWIKAEYENEGSIFGIDKGNFFTGNTQEYKLWDEKYSTVLGPAAGPHTQCAQNLVAAYLCGSRFFELKTVQVMDELDIPKPCIEAEHEGYNTEWSTELTVEDAYREYVKAWFIIHYLPELLGENFAKGNNIIFNMSVGYDLKGIKTPKIDNFIENLKDASNEEYFNKCKAELKKFCLQDIEVPANITKSITLSTMHGCPPEEQESICNYLLKEKKLHTFVKLNPTLLGYDFVNDVLEKLGFECALKQESFTNDLQFEPAMQMLNTLLKTAEEQNLVFGVKLSNTLPVVNEKQVLPGDEMYMSGKSLFPLTINLALKLYNAFGNKLPISYCGGAEEETIEKLYSAGLRPVTLATNLLKPGGYGRIKQMADMLSILPYKEGIDKAKLQEIAVQSINPQKLYEKSSHTLKGKEVLPLWDCDLAGCRNGCPINQDIPSYINAVNMGDYAKASEIILQRNPLPHITGHICEQPCQTRCTRIDYEDSIHIREIKQTAILNGYSEIIKKIEVKKSTKGKVAILGAGPAGLSAGYFLCKHGFAVDVYEKETKAGGLVRHVIPDFRLADEMIDNDLEIIKRYGVKFHFNQTFSIDELKKKGYDYIIIAVGAGVSKELSLRGQSKKLISGIEFLKDYKAGNYDESKAENVIIIGGGNSAMDSARAALRLPNTKKVCLVYRRTKSEMPADKEELNNALDEGVILKELLQPVAYENDILQCKPMKLGVKGADGRRSVSESAEEAVSISAELVISAIGEEVDKKLLEVNGISDYTNMNTNLENVYLIGDAYRGPSSVVQAMADGITTAKDVLHREGIEWQEYDNTDFNIDYHELKKKKAKIEHPQRSLNLASEVKRCLQCDVFCSKCAEVCPNRANISIKVSSEEFKHKYQIIHLDKLCNECGNCETFCPYSGAPYKDKFTLFHDEKAFEESTNEGVIFGGENKGKFRYKGMNGKLTDNLPVELDNIIKTLKQDYNYLLEI